MAREYRRFTKEFKLNALKMMENSNRPMSQLARELDIHVNMLYKWKKEQMTKQDKAFKRTEDDQERELNDLESLKQALSKLKKENERLRAEKDILKKATAYFANESK